MICEAFDIAVVPFPFVDQPSVKRRPALVLSSLPFNEANGHTILAMITSSTRDQWPDDHPIRNLEKAGLNVACRVRWKIFTLPNAMILKMIGTLGKQDRHDTSDILARIMPTVQPPQ